MEVPIGIQLLNASYEPLSSNYPLKKAIRLLALGKATIEEAYEEMGYLDPVRGWLYPKILRLVNYVKIKYDKVYGAKKWSKRGVLFRDNYICAYCDGKADTIDHIIPRSKFDSNLEANTWLNTIASCFACNSRKRNRTPEEAGMVLLFQPLIPKRIAYR